MPHRPSEVDPLKCHRSGCWVLLWSKFWWQRTIFPSWLMRQSPSLVRPQTGQGFDLLLGARFPRVLENCPSIGLLLLYIDFCSLQSEVDYQKPLHSDTNWKQRFFGVYRYLTNLGHGQSILMFPFPIVRSGGLRQGFDKFYSLSFQARLSLFIFSLVCRSPES
jgi:hypothetical protein